MRPLLRGLFSLAALGLLLGTGCTRETLDEKLDRADSWLRHRGGEAHYRAAAIGLYREVLDAEPTSAQRVRAQFGVGMIGVADLLQAVPLLVDSLAADPDAPAEDDGSALPPAADLVPVILQLLQSLLDDGIVRPWTDVLTTAPDFSFQFGPDPADPEARGLVLPALFEGGNPLNLNGVWDRVEIGLIRGLLQTVLALVDGVAAYDGVLLLAFELALGEGEVPEVPPHPADWPDWVVDALTARGVSPLPWLRDDFGRLSDLAAWAGVRTRASDGLNGLAAAFASLVGDTRPADVLLSRDRFIQDLLALAGVDGGIIGNAVAGVLPATTLSLIVDDLALSLDEADAVFVPGPGLVNLIDLLSLLYPGPNDPVGLRWPGLNPSVLFDDPATDLKLVLPVFDADGRFAVASEQEPCFDGSVLLCLEFDDVGVDGAADTSGDGQADDPNAAPVGAGNGVWDEPIALRDGDTGPPLVHVNPQGVTEPANGIVDPLYLFFDDASFGGVLRLLEVDPDGGGNSYRPATDATYANPDLMRLLSSILWLAEAAGSE